MWEDAPVLRDDGVGEDLLLRLGLLLVPRDRGSVFPFLQLATHFRGFSVQVKLLCESGAEAPRKMFRSGAPEILAPRPVAIRPYNYCIFPIDIGRPRPGPLDPAFVTHQPRPIYLFRVA